MGGIAGILQTGLDLSVLGVQVFRIPMGGLTIREHLSENLRHPDGVDSSGRVCHLDAGFR